MRFFAMAVVAATLVGTSMAAAQTRGITRQTWGKTAAGEAVDLYTLTNGKGASVQIATLGGTVVFAEGAGQDGQARRRGARLRLARRVPRRAPLLRRAGRPLRQPHRQRAVHARRQDVHAGEEQRRQHPARRASRASTSTSGRRARCHRPTAWRSNSPT